MIALAATALAAAPALAAGPNSVYGLYGDNSEISVYGAGASFDWLRKDAPGTGSFAARIDAEIAYWHGKDRAASDRSLWAAGVMPVFRWTFLQTQGASLFAEAGLGVHLLSKTRINSDRRFGTAFQFGELGGIGVAFGPKLAYEVELELQHVSNGGIRHDANWGETFPALALRVALP